ncbi:hypothetical protein [Bradyrhizobium liaoningense]|uniref:hypothetical protein n=1 Tax=Bradyrhizobium liaoningense TaxID=43992 RepID=UPI001BA81C41|nr:hypothetical protein [Bradyrhizobium liaoningense]MBR0855460.1 hypothetical protein [Bradyrhizobium liaoningense]
MPSRKIHPGDTIYVRATALEVHPDFLQVRIEDGAMIFITNWVPARECARLEDIGDLKPPRRANPRHIDR